MKKFNQASAEVLKVSKSLFGRGEKNVGGGGTQPQLRSETAKQLGNRPSPEFLSSLSFTKKFYPLPKVEGIVTVLSPRERARERGQSLFATRTVKVFSPFTTHFSLKRAFTLAEVLVTLGIIGVVAALTMPSLIVKYEKQKTVTQLKKAYSELNQAIKLAEIDHGPLADWEYGTAFDGVSAENFANKYLVPYMNVVKNCGANSGCLNGEVYYVNGTREPNYYGDSSTSTAKFVVNSGYVFCVTSGGDYVTISIVINNKKDRINTGKDVFFMTFNQTSSSVPSHDDLKAQCNKDTLGFGCLSLIQADGWQISDDYPW